jgi:hypothetical protein
MLSSPPAFHTFAEIPRIYELMANLLLFKYILYNRVVHVIDPVSLTLNTNFSKRVAINGCSL